MADWTPEELAELEALAEDAGVDVRDIVPSIVIPVRRARITVSPYQPEYVDLARRLCSQFGATDQDLAEFFSVSIKTIYNWYVKHADFREAVRLAKDFADDRVEQSLYRRAIGYTVETEKIFLPRGSKVPVVVPTSEQVGPDTTACIFWLKNRRRAEWRDRVDTHINGKDAGPVDLSVSGGAVAVLTEADMEAVRALLG